MKDEKCKFCLDEDEIVVNFCGFDIDLVAVGNCELEASIDDDFGIRFEYVSFWLESIGSIVFVEFSVEDDADAIEIWVDIDDDFGQAGVANDAAIVSLING